MINDTLLDAFRVLTKDRSQFCELTDDFKDKYFFIINRYLSKKYFKFAQELNNKKIDKPTGFDMWFYFLEKQPYPKWFWSKSAKKDKIGDIKEKDKISLMKLYNIEMRDIEYIMKWFPKEVKQDLKWITDIEKQNK